MPRRVARRAGAACVALALLTIGCEGARQEGGESSPAAITVLDPAEERVLGPVWDDTPKFLMFLPLVNFERGSSCGEPTPALAERWEHSPDYRVWTVWLRGDVLWHDGVPVTAGDIKFTVDLLKHPDVLNYNAFGVDSVEVLDERTVRIFLTEPGRWPLEGWVTFYPKHLLEELDPKEFYEWEFWTHPVGDGPFRYVRHVPRTMMELEANPEYYRGKPRIERVILRFVAAGSGTGLLEMRSGNADLTSFLRPVEAKQLALDPRFRVHYRVSTSHASWLVYNPRNPLFQDVRVRRALTHAVDRRALHAALDLPDDLPLTDAPYTVCQFERRELAEPWPHDPVAAARLLEAAGWRDEDGEGVRERNGKIFRFMTLVPPQEARAALVLQAQLHRVGVRMELQRLDGSLIAERIREGNFEAVIPPTWGIQPVLISSPGGSGRLNAVFTEAYASIVGLFDAAGQEPDFTERERLFRELARTFRRELPATYLYPRASPIVARRRIHGFDHDGWIPPAWRWAFGGLEWLWVEAQDRTP
ncbi:MAG: ABC transporter substrate-binding protein [Acidobacteriota bacterium]